MNPPPANDDPTTLNDLLPTTPDGRAERLAELKRLFPDLFTNEGRLNPDELRQLVEPNAVLESERYEFKWDGKAASKREAFTPTTATLVHDEARSVNREKADGNMIIEGENLEVLKLLLNAYREQVKCIDIDPPYNTGKDFIYRDDYKKERAKYWEETGATEDGVRLESNPETSGRDHSNWLSMMQSRLLVAHALLKNDGVIFLSIDDSEVENAGRLLDSIFGESNFVAQVVWEGAFKNDSRQIGTNHEYVLVLTEQLTPPSVIYQPARSASERLAKLFEADVFEFPKDDRVLQKFVETATGSDSIVVDFFAGSGTTAHAVLNENQRDGGSRKFIMVQLPEEASEGSLGAAAGYKTISAITIERVKRVIEGYGEDPKPMPEAGFRVYTLRKSNFPRCEFRPDPEVDEAANVAALRHYIEEKEAAFFLTLEGEGERAVFDEVLLKNGFALHYERERDEAFGENTVWRVRDGRREALVCLAWNESIKDGTIKRLREMAEADGRSFFICLERSLSTTTKWVLKHCLSDHFVAF